MSPKNPQNPQPPQSWLSLESARVRDVASEYARVRDVASRLASVKSNWGTFLLIELLDLGCNGEEVPSDKLIAAAYSARYGRELDATDLVDRKDALKAALRNGWKTLEQEVLPELNRLLAEDSETENLVLSVSKSIGSGSGNKSTYACEIDGEVSNQESNKEHKKADAHLVKYRVCSIPAMPWYSGWLSRLDPRTPSTTVYWFLLALLVGGFSALVLTVLLNASSVGVALFITAPIGLLFYRMLMPFVFAHHFRSALAPRWMGRISNLLIEWRPAKTAEPHAEPSVMRLASYQADCPKCGGRLVLKNGGLRHFGRIIAGCEWNPREHIFSFDHITKTGHEI